MYNSSILVIYTENTWVVLVEDFHNVSKFVLYSFSNFMLIKVTWLASLAKHEKKNLKTSILEQFIVYLSWFGATSVASRITHNE